MKALGIAVPYVVVSGGIWYLISDNVSVVRALVFGVFVGAAGVGIYYLEKRRKPAK